jgi:uncharacterized protein YcfJ
MLRAILGVATLALATHAAAQVTFWEDQGFHGRAFSTNNAIVNLGNSGFNDRASSAIVERGRWEICEHAGFAGRCVILGPGQYPSLAQFGMNDMVSSVRPAGRRSQVEYVAPPSPPPPQQAYAYYPRHGERLFEANVTAVRAVVSQPQQRCWVERQQVVQNSDATVPGAIIGGVLGGVLGHQVGGGRGQDVATALGAVGGAVAGANVGRNAGGSQVVTQDVHRCTNVGGPVRPDYWDVTYVFRGQEHRVQMASPPGATITVNRNGEPRM